MKIYYRILSVDEKEHSIVVRYYTDKVKENELAIELDENGNPSLTKDGYPIRCRTDINLSIFKTPSPTLKEIEEMIEASAPISWFKMQEDIKNEKIDTSLSDFKKYIGKPKSFIYKPPPMMPLPPHLTK